MTPDQQRFARECAESMRSVADSTVVVHDFLPATERERSLVSMIGTLRRQINLGADTLDHLARHDALS